MLMFCIQSDIFQIKINIHFFFFFTNWHPAVKKKMKILYKAASRIFYHIVDLIKCNSIPLCCDQAFRRGDTHQDPEHGWLLRPVWRREVCHARGTCPVLHGEHGAAEGTQRWRHRAQIPCQQWGPDHREVGRTGEAQLYVLLVIRGSGKQICLFVAQSFCFHLLQK